MFYHILCFRRLAMNQINSRRGSILIIALITVAFLGALAVAVMNPVSTSQDITDVMYNLKHATFAANSAAERARYIMSQDGAVAEDGTSQCVLDAISAGKWTPVSFEDNGNKDENGITFPAIDMLDGAGSPLFDISTPDPDFPPIPYSSTDNEIAYIIYTTEDGTGNAVSYVSARCNGVVRNIRVQYRRELARDFPHPSYLHAIYAANEDGSPGYKFLLDTQTGTKTDDIWDWKYWNEISANSNLSTNGCINLKEDDTTRGHLGFNIPDKTLKEGEVPVLYLYLQNIPAKKDVKVNIHELSGPLPNDFSDTGSFGSTIGAKDIDGDTKNQYIPFQIDRDTWNAHKGDVLYVSMSYDRLEPEGPSSAVHFKCKDNQPPVLHYVTEEEVTGTDEVAGDIFINGDVDISDADVAGDTKGTGNVDGDGNGEEQSGADPIPPPDLSKGGEWYKSLGLNSSGTSSTNPDVVTDASDGSTDNRIAGIICPHTQTGESQDYMDDDATSSVTYVIDSNFGQQAGPSDTTYDSGTDSVIVTVPDEFNNKAVYIPGDFWCDILDPTFIDFRSSSGKPVTLTFIVEGNIYLTDGVNRKRHPDSAELGAISFISLKNDSGTGGNIYYGDPSTGGGRLDPVKAYLYAENDFKWFQKAMNAGDFDIIGNMTSGDEVDFSDRKTGTDFVPINVQFDPAILDPEVRKGLPCLPRASTTDIIPGTPYSQCSFTYLDDVMGNIGGQ